MKIKLDTDEYQLIIEALRSHALAEMERVSSMASSNERTNRSFRAGLAAGLAFRIEREIKRGKGKK